MNVNKRQINKLLQELDTLPLPDKESILSAIPDSLAQDIQPEAVSYAAGRRRPYMKPVLALCAILVLLLSGFSVYAIAAEGQAYKKAVTFFDEYDLSTEGLSRGDIKSIYRDISTGTFSYDKTATVIKNKIGGYTIEQAVPSPEDVENLWNRIIGKHMPYLIPGGRVDGKDIAYQYHHAYKRDDSLGFDVFDYSTFEKYVDGEKVWEARFDDFSISSFKAAGDAVFVYGNKSVWSSSQDSPAYIAMVDADGHIRWQQILENGFGWESIASVLPDKEEITIFSQGDSHNLCLTKLDYDGNVLSSHQSEMGNYGIWNAAKLEDGYIVQLGSYITGEFARIVKVGNDGAIADSFTYSSDNDDYYITDMLEYNGNIYLSGYSVPHLGKDEGDAGGRSDIAAILNYIFENNRMDITNEELTKLVREHFTAVLLVCDPASGEPHTFLSVGGSVGSKLAVSDQGHLLWDVESITDTYFSPLTSSFTIGGASYVYRYTFDEAGKLLRQEKTGELANFRR